LKVVLDTNILVSASVFGGLSSDILACLEYSAELLSSEKLIEA